MTTLPTIGKTWPYVEAKKALQHAEREAQRNNTALNEIVLDTGYGPSGLPHLGTFAEVFRTTVVARAIDDTMGIAHVADSKTKIIAFSDDFDGLRRAPDNVPNKALLEQHLGMPLKDIPDPFGTAPSFADYNNARLRMFLDRFGFRYAFYSSANCYRTGMFNAALREILHVHAEIVEIVAASVGEDRARHYSPFLPVCPESGRVLLAEVVATDAAAGTLDYRHPDSGAVITTAVTDGRCKLQWKADWGMRWKALGVNYEMYGKDLIDSAAVSAKVCRAIGARPPAGMFYELFVDEAGKKISKSKGNGLSIEEWLQYGDAYSLCHFLMRRPQTVKELGANTIVAETDEYFGNLTRFHRSVEAGASVADNPVAAIHRIVPGVLPTTNGTAPDGDRQAFADVQAESAEAILERPVSKGQGADIAAQASNNVPTAPVVGIGMVIRLIASSGITDPHVLRDYVARFAPNAPQQSPPGDQAAHDPMLAMITRALAWQRTFGVTTNPRRATESEQGDVQYLRDRLTEASDALWSDGAALQNFIRDVGKGRGYDNPRDWYVMLYELLFGASSGPRLGAFFALSGRALTDGFLVEVVNP
ncbi:MAG: lysine--tRNA ligase [Alphaproteobacteria bacterium]|nr:lysine--tRNA ligase [Alphaproteobacteria bacterium]